MCCDGLKIYVANFFKTDQTTVLFKTIFMILHVFFLILAALFLTYAILKRKELENVTIISFCVASCVLVLLVILGYFGIYRESVTVNLVYTFTLLFLLFLQLFIIFCVLDYEGDKNEVKKKWEEEITMPGSMNELHRKLECCGRESPVDWENVFSRTIPDSCRDGNNKIYKYGCLFIVEKSERAGEKVKTWLWFAFILTIFILVLSCYLTYHFYKKHRAPAQHHPK